MIILERTKQELVVFLFRGNREYVADPLPTNRIEPNNTLFHRAMLSVDRCWDGGSSFSMGCRIPFMRSTLRMRSASPLCAVIYKLASE